MSTPQIVIDPANPNVAHVDVPTGQPTSQALSYAASQGWQADPPQAAIAADGSPVLRHVLRK
ncbi:hypothetical protein ACWCXC_34980 [Streptomyces sp. NPDC001515]